MAQMHRSYDDRLQGTDDQEIHGGETKSAMQKVKAKVEQLKDTITHGHGLHDESVNNTPAVRSGVVQPTATGSSVLVEDMYSTHSDILDPPTRSFAQWEAEEKRGDPPPLSTEYYPTHLSSEHEDRYGAPTHLSSEYEDRYRAPSKQSTGIYGTHPSAEYEVRQPFADMYTVRVPEEHEDRHGVPPPRSARNYETPSYEMKERHDEPDESTGVYVMHPGGKEAYAHDYNREQPVDSFGKSTGMQEDPNAPNTSTDYPPNYQSKVADPLNAGGHEVGITGVLKSFDKMGIYDEPENRSSKPDEIEPRVYTGSHDQFKPDQSDNPPLDTIAADPSNKNSSYMQKMASAKSAITDKAAAVKDSVVSKLSPSGEKKNVAMDYAHKVSDTVTGTLSPVYEKVVGAGSTVKSKIHGSGNVDTTESPVTTVPPERKGVTRVTEYLVESLKPGDEDKVLSETITNALHRGEVNAPADATTTTTTTTYVVKDGRLQDIKDGKLQDSSN